MTISDFRRRASLDRPIPTFPYDDLGPPGTSSSGWAEIARSTSGQRRPETRDDVLRDVPQNGHVGA
jgi:hypothetical protein